MTTTKNTKVFSILTHGDYNKNRFKIPSNIRLFKYSAPGKVLYLSDLIYMINNKRIYNNRIGEPYSLYHGLNNGHIINSDIIPRVENPKTFIRDMNLNFVDTIKSTKTGVYNHLLSFDGNENKNEEDIFNYNKHQIPELSYQNESTTLSQKLTQISYYITKKYGENVICNVHQFTCHAGNYINKRFTKKDIEQELSMAFSTLSVNNYLNTTHLTGKELIVSSFEDKDKVLDELKKYLSIKHIKLNLLDNNILDFIDSNLLDNCSDKNRPKLKHLKNDDYIIVGGNFHENFICMALLKEREDGYYIYSVCIHKEFRGRNYSNLIFSYIANNCDNQNKKIILDASHLEGEGLNQSSRIKIYSKMGFTIPINTFIGIKKEKSVINAQIKNIVVKYKNQIEYNIETKLGENIIIKPGRIVSCPTHQNGCLMETTPKILLEFLNNSNNNNTKKRKKSNSSSLMTKTGITKRRKSNSSKNMSISSNRSSNKNMSISSNHSSNQMKSV